MEIAWAEFTPAASFAGGAKLFARLGARGRPRAAESVARRFTRGVIVQAVLVVHLMPSFIPTRVVAVGARRARTRPRLLVEIGDAHVFAVFALPRTAVVEAHLIADVGTPT